VLLILREVLTRASALSKVAIIDADAAVQQDLQELIRNLTHSKKSKTQVQTYSSLDGLSQGFFSGPSRCNWVVFIDAVLFNQSSPSEQKEFLNLFAARPRDFQIVFMSVFFFPGLDELEKLIPGSLIIRKPLDPLFLGSFVRWVLTHS
jgi:hypothetical protein